MGDEGFLEALSAEDPSIGAAMLETPPEGDADLSGGGQPGESGTGTPPEGEAATPTETPNSQQTPAPGATTDWEDQASYWKGRYDATQGNGNGGAQASPAQPQMSDDDKARREEEFINDPYGVMEKREAESSARIEASLRMNFSVSAMRRETDDYDQVISDFAKLADKDPSLAARIGTDPDPARFAYNFVKQRETLKDYDGDPKKLEAAIEKKVRAEIAAEQSKAQKLDDADATPPTPAGGSASGGTAPANPNKVPADPLADNAFD